MIRDWRPAGRLQIQALPTVHMAFPQEGTARALWIRNPVCRFLTRGQTWVQRGRDAPAITCKSVEGGVSWEMVLNFHRLLEGLGDPERFGDPVWGPQATIPDGNTEA